MRAYNMEGERPREPDDCTIGSNEYPIFNKECPTEHRRGILDNASA